ncbi:MAG: hypothetical protein EPO26_02730 [Chloroflexota bacterium]|nr:MAG: hypothetical protein EPO26_02730 [Chloroflexota bacterium]
MTREGDATQQPDERIAAAYRLARLHALLSPRLLSQELSIDRAEAQRLLDEMETREFVGPVIIAATGARESRVNVVMDVPADDGRIVASTLGARETRRALFRGIAVAMLGVAIYAGIDAIGLGPALVAWFRVGLASRTLAALVIAFVPLIGPGIAWLAEAPFRQAEDLLPYEAMRVRALIWQGSIISLVLFSIVRLLR